MATWIDAESLIALGAAGVFYGFACFAVRKRTPVAKWALRLVLLAVFFAPVLWVALLGPHRPYAQRAAPWIADVGGQGAANNDDLAMTVAPVASDQWETVRVFYGTDRAHVPGSGRLQYGSGRAGRLEIGRVDVSVPKAHEGPQIERPWRVRLPFTNVTVLEQSENPNRHFTMRESAALSPETFVNLVRNRLVASTVYRDRAVVFVHGYNTDFDYAIFRTAQMAYDLKFDGAPFLYSWPSSSGVTGYVYDRDSAEQSEPHFKQFLSLIVKETGAKKISLIAHSMGNRPLLHVLRQIEPDLPSGVSIDQVILAAPDVDRDVFEQLIRGVTREDRGITLYASKYDRAMAAARLVAGGVPRAGDVPPEGPIVVAGVDTIDISATSNDGYFLNHSVYAQSRILITDIAALISTGVRPPDKRMAALQRVTTARGDYWLYVEPKRPESAHKKNKIEHFQEKQLTKENKKGT